MDIKLLKLYWLNNSDILEEINKVLERDKKVISSKKSIKIHKYVEKHFTTNERDAIDNLYYITINFPELEELDELFRSRIKKSFDDMLQSMSDHYMEKWELDEAENILKQIN